MANYPYFKPEDESQLAYIRLVDPAKLPSQVRKETEGMDRVYAIHNAEGQVLALVDNRDKAFVVARMNEMHPVSAH
jgi:hypothetical protein